MSSPLSSLGPGINLSSTQDGLFYGYAVATALFGVTIVQAWIYIQTNRDKWPLRTLVAVLVLADFATTCMQSQVVHYYFVANFGNLETLSFTSRPLTWEILISVGAVFCVQIFFASRVWLLGRTHWTVPLLIILSAIGGGAAGFAQVIGEFQNNSEANLAKERPKIELAFNAVLDFVSDITTTVALSWTFKGMNSGIKRTDTLINKMFQYAVTRGIFVTVNQLAFLILYLVNTEKLWWMPFQLSITKIYVITMVAILNSRDSVRTHRSPNHIITDSDMPISRAITFQTFPSTAVTSSSRNSELAGRGDFSVSGIGGNGSRKEKEADSVSDNFDIEMNSYSSSEIQVTTTVSTHRDLPPEAV
ncbi:hypothetical protein BDP27DRAFT_1347892 [Rhodocollybia butyracea]|uniref:DUF6534 domain-containing protein n=1 Tax=Rhodocollybia butyracea TaxID=206335 RepID=A0A9P5P1S1_9AGAR|nr:hypothetical protein BDP27DRAFT_1347892 [Rhodocollybia butyracea]